MAELLKPKRGGFLRPFGCGWFIREFLSGNGPYDSPKIDPAAGAPQAFIFQQYKNALIRETAKDRATRAEEKRAAREKRIIDPDNIDELTNEYLERMPYKAQGCRYHSFVVYFSTLKRLGWVELSGAVEPSLFQRQYSAGPPRKYYRITTAGRTAGDTAWANHNSLLYGS